MAALLLAINPFHVYYSQEIRMYGLMVLWSLLAIGFAARCVGDWGTVDKESGQVDKVAGWKE